MSMAKCTRSRFFTRMLVFALVLVMAIGAVPVSAAKLSTVTVNTKKKLVAAMRNSSVGTIIFESETGKGISIPD